MQLAPQSLSINFDLPRYFAELVSCFPPVFRNTIQLLHLVSLEPDMKLEEKYYDYMTNTSTLLQVILLDLLHAVRLQSHST